MQILVWSRTLRREAKESHWHAWSKFQGNIPRTNHQAVIEQAVLAQSQLTNLVRQHYTGNDSCARRSQTATQRDRVDDVHGGLDGECALVMATEDIEGDPGDKVDLGIETNLLGGLALVLVGDGAVERECGGALGGVDGDVDVEMEGQGQADHVEAGADVGGGARGSDQEGGGHGGRREINCESEASDDSMARYLERLVQLRGSCYRAFCVGVAMNCMEGLDDSNAGLGKKKECPTSGRVELINCGLVASQLARWVRLD